MPERKVLLMPKVHNKPLAPLAYFGGKAWLTKKLDLYMPPHKTYVEVFAGSAKILFQKQRSVVEVINDRYEGLINFYRVLQDPEKYKELQKLAYITPYSREEFNYCKENWEHYRSDIDRARAWFVGQRQARYGLFGSSWKFDTKPGTNAISKSVGAWLSSIEFFPEFHDRLQGVRIENRDFREIIPEFDSPDTWFYADPPYVLSTRVSGEYAHEMNDADHLDLLSLLTNIKGSCLLSGYPHPLYDLLEFLGWKKEQHKIKCSSSNAKNNAPGQKGTKPDRTECLWLSPKLLTELRGWERLDKAA
jgi:DNA adenine methylase